MRSKPYTDTGISRVPCQRCGKPSKNQWQICATGNEWAGVCVECDIALNKMVLEFFHLPSSMGRAYAANKRVLHNPNNSKAAKTARGSALISRRIQTPKKTGKLSRAAIRKAVKKISHGGR